MRECLCLYYVANPAGAFYRTEQNRTEHSDSKWKTRLRGLGDGAVVVARGLAEDGALVVRAHRLQAVRGAAEVRLLEHLNRERVNKTLFDTT